MVFWTTVQWAGNTEKGVKQGKSSYPLLSMKKDQANKTNVERVYRQQPLVWEPGPNGSGIDLQLVDRKSTRLNSSHQIISYAVFCLKKKKLTKPLTNSKYRTFTQLSLVL